MPRYRAERGRAQTLATLRLRSIRGLPCSAAERLLECGLQQLEAEVNLEHVDGRAKLKALAAPLFARMPEGIYREMLAESLAARVGMPATALKKSFVSGDSRPRGDSRPAAGGSELAVQRGSRMSVGRGNLLTQAITLVLHHPSAAASVKDPDALGQVDKPGVAVLKELLLQAAAATRRADRPAGNPLARPRP